jgi:hypothetical protein
MGAGGALLRFGLVGLRILQFGCAAVGLGIYSYFLAVLANHNYIIPTWEKAVEGLVGAATLYTIFGIILGLCLAGNKFFGFLAVFLDILFVGAFAAVAYYTRHGANACRGIVNTPLGVGRANDAAPGAGDYGYVCSLNTAVFAVSILAIFLFLVTAAWQIMVVKHHQKEKRYGPGPSNNYSTKGGRGSKFAFWKRNKVTKGTRDAEMATAHTSNHHGRHSTETGMTGSTMNHGGYAPNTTDHTKYGQPGYAAPNGAPHYDRATNY